MSGKVIGLENEVKAAEERLCEASENDDASREAMIIEARQWDIEDFKQLEYNTSQNYDAGYNDGYDKGVEEIFFNIWRKHREVDFKFLGKEYQVLMVDWEEQEKKSELDTKPPPSLKSSKKDYEIIETKPADKAQDQALKAWISSPTPRLVFFFWWCNDHKELIFATHSAFF